MGNYTKKMFAISALMILCHSRIIGQSRTCSRTAAEMADREASRLQTWGRLYHSYLRYSGCDDGSIWEGYSDSVVRLLAHHWTTFPQAFPLFANNDGFYKFVLKHIDATTLDNDLKAIRANAIQSCPKGGSKYCIQIRKAAENALHDITTPG